MLTDWLEQAVFYLLVCWFVGRYNLERELRIIDGHMIGIHQWQPSPKAEFTCTSQFTPVHVRLQCCLCSSLWFGWSHLWPAWTVDLLLCFSWRKTLNKTKHTFIVLALSLANQSNHEGKMVACAVQHRNVGECEHGCLLSAYIWTKLITSLAHADY